VATFVIAGKGGVTIFKYMKTLRKPIVATVIVAKGTLPLFKYMKLLVNPDCGNVATTPI
jgi:hypothetical protein